MIRRAAALALLLFAMGAISATGPTTAYAQPAPADDAWGFEEEEEAVPGWGEAVASQATDIAAFTAFAALAMVSFFRKSVPLKVATFIASVAYLGFYKSQLISIVNVYALLTWNLPVVKFSLGWYLFAGFTLVSTVLWGRLYCGRICAYGALTQLLDHVVPDKMRFDVPLAVEKKANYIKYGILALILAYFFATQDIRAYRYVEPFWLFSLQGSTVLWIALGVLLVATVFVRNLYCRFLCPLGAFLGLVSRLTVFKIKRWSECSSCKLCEKTCQWGAIDGPRIVMTECVRCDDCERLYMDQQKCPHWIIIQRKSDVLARQAAAAIPQN